MRTLRTTIELTEVLNRKIKLTYEKYNTWQCPIELTNEISGLYGFSGVSWVKHFESWRTDEVKRRYIVSLEQENVKRLHCNG